MSGRISDIAVYEAKPTTFYVGTAHGGVWKTTSNGTLFTPLLQDQGLLSIGDVAVSQTNPDVVWVGTGESNNRQSTSWGDGIYKSTDGGKTFTNVGLRDSKHIGRILIDPANNDVVIVAAQGPLFGPGGERGIYKTTNGGQSWTQVLKVDDETGATDLAMSRTDPEDDLRVDVSAAPRRLLHERRRPGQRHLEIDRRRRPLDAPHRQRLARGIARPHRHRHVSQERQHRLRERSKGPAVAAAVVAARRRRPRRWRPAAGGRGGRTRAAPAPAATTGVYRSDDGGQSWRKVSGTNPRPMYFSQMRVDPNNADRIYMGGVAST